MANEHDNGHNGKRAFTDSPAVRTSVPLLIGLMGPSGGGKTFSALRLAGGIQRVSGGDIFVIDTEAKRALHYADRFKFQHVPFAPPFGPLDYLAAVEHCISRGAKVVIVDSMSHEHEGPGGVLEMHEAEVRRLSGGNLQKAERVKMLAWSKPKQERRRFINTVLQMPAHFIFCFRAKQKIKIERGKDPEPRGFMPIAGEEFVYEMMVNALLMPAAGGIPTWQSEESGERMMIKLPEQFQNLFRAPVPLSEDHGTAIAKWAAGSADPDSLYSKFITQIKEVGHPEALETIVPEIETLRTKKLVPPAEYRLLKDALSARRKELAAKPLDYGGEAETYTSDGE